jgi:hypothetical protein
LLKPKQIGEYFMDSISPDSENDNVAAEHKGVKKLGQSVCYNRSVHPCGVAVQDVPVHPVLLKKGLMNRVCRSPDATTSSLSKPVTVHSLKPIMIRVVNYTWDVMFHHAMLK